MMAIGTRRIARRGGLTDILAVAILAAMAAGGCKRTSTASAGGVKPIDPSANVTPGQIVQAYQPCLATIQTTWEQRGSLLSGWRTYGVEGTGIIVSSDGHSALVLTSRHLVDPRYRRDDSITRRNVQFRVSSPQAAAPGSGANARLVAVYLSDADLALLRIGAPWPEPFAIPLAESGAPAVGDDVAVIGPPAISGLVVSNGMINNFWQDRRSGTSSMQIRLTDGPPATAGAVFTVRGGRLVGILRGQERTGPGVTGDLFAESTEALRNRDFWSFLVEEDNTRRLLARIR